MKYGTLSENISQPSSIAGFLTNETAYTPFIEYSSNILPSTITNSGIFIVIVNYFLIVIVFVDQRKGLVKYTPYVIAPRWQSWHPALFSSYPVVVSTGHHSDRKSTRLNSSHLG